VANRLQCDTRMHGCTHLERREHGLVDAALKAAVVLAEKDDAGAGAAQGLQEEGQADRQTVG